MRHLTRLSISVLLVAALLLPAVRAHASAYDAHPKLVVLLIADALPGGSLERYRSDFKGEGLLLLLDHGANFNDCYFDSSNTGAAPGDAALLTGAYADGNGIASDRWWDVARNKERPVGAVEDTRYHLVGVPDGEKPEPGASPLNLRASTLGDELRMGTRGTSRVFTVSLKEQGAVLTGGYTANGAYWVDPKSGYFITSSYYMNSLPEWTAAFNASGRIAQAEEETGKANQGNVLEGIAGTPAAVSYEFDFTRALITGEKLGSGATTDLLVLNLPGEARNPEDQNAERQMIDALDGQLSSFTTWLKKNIPGGLSSVWISFTADRGASPSSAEAQQLGFPAARIDTEKFVTSLNESMNAKFSPGEKLPYMLPQQQLPYISLDDATFESVGVNEPEAERAVLEAVPAAVQAVAPAASAGQNSQTESSGAEAAADSNANSASNPNASPSTAPDGTQENGVNSKPRPAGPPAGAPPSTTAGPAEAAPAPVPLKRLPPIPIVVDAYSRRQLAAGTLPPSEWGRILAHSYSSNGGWYVMVIPGAYQAQTTGSIQSPWSYARHVPLLLYGDVFTPGFYRKRVQPVDLTATLASLLGINQPSASIGSILTPAIREVPRAARRTPRSSSTTRRRTPAARRGEAR